MFVCLTHCPRVTPASHVAGVAGVEGMCACSSRPSPCGLRDGLGDLLYIYMCYVYIYTI